MKILKWSGPKTAPCNTPYSTSQDEEKSPKETTCDILLVSNYNTILNHQHTVHNHEVLEGPIHAEEGQMYCWNQNKWNGLTAENKQQE